MHRYFDVSTFISIAANLIEQQMYDIWVVKYLVVNFVKL